jgi:hypothetical protein
MEHSGCVCQLCGIGFNIGRIRQRSITSSCSPLNRVHYLYTILQTSLKVAPRALLDDPAHLLSLMQTKRNGQSVKTVKTKNEDVLSTLSRKEKSTWQGGVADWSTKGTLVVKLERKR